MKTIIQNIDVVSPTAILPNRDVIIEQDTIIEIEKNGSYQPDNIDLIIDGEGLYLIPGLIDIHTHGCVGNDVMDATPESLQRMAAFYAKNGTLGFLATTMTNPFEKIDEALQNVKKHMSSQDEFNDQAHLFGVYLEGPYFSPKKKGAQPLSDLRNPNIDELTKFLQRDVIKVVALAPELPNTKEVIQYLKEHQVEVAMGHSFATYDETKDAINLGATIATHLYNGMREFTHREPGIIGAVLSDDQVYTELIVDLVHLHPGAIHLAFKSKSKDKIILISDSIRATGLPDGTYDLGGQMVETKNGIAWLESNTLAGSTLTLIQAVRNMVQRLAYPLEDAVLMATLNPAKAIHIEKQYGSIEVGKKANLVFLDKELTIKNIMLNGRLSDY